MIPMMRLSTGLQIGWTVSGYTPGRFPISEIMILHLGFNTAEHAGKVLYDLYQKFPEIRAEYKDTHVLWLSPAPPRQTHSRMAVRKVEDFKGIKVRVPATEAPNVKALGGIPVSMAGPDVYQALERGILDADLHPWETPFSYKWYEVVRFHSCCSPLRLRVESQGRCSSDWESLFSLKFSICWESSQDEC